MAYNQGFRSINGALYIFQVNTDTDSISAAMGIDNSGATTSTWSLNLSTIGDAQPGVGFQPLLIDAVTGVITFTPLGGGYVRVDGPLDVTGGITFAGDLALNNTAVSTAASSLIFQKDRAGATIVSGDDLGQIYFKGFDGTDYVTSASIRSDSSGTIAANRVAGNLVFATHPDSASGLTPTDRMTISRTGAVTIATTDAMGGDSLTIGSGLTISAGTILASGLATAGVVQTDIMGTFSTSAGTNGQILISSTGLAPAWTTITAGAGITVTNGAGSITIATSGGTTWNEVVGASAGMSVDNGYIANNAGLVTLTLPAVAVVGDTIEVTGKGAGGWLIAQNAGQTIYFGASTTTTGVGGSLSSTAVRDSIRLVCVTANNDWNVLSAQGTITVV